MMLVLYMRHQKSVFWQTNAGNMVPLNEGEISYLSIGATTESNLPATLSVSPHSNPFTFRIGFKS